MLPTLRRLPPVASALRLKSARRRRSYAAPALEALERRDLLSVSTVFFSGSTLVVRSDALATSVEVNSTLSGVQVREVGTNRTWSYTAGQVGFVEFQGSNANDRFVNNVATLGVRAFGFGGDDFLQGGDVADALIGGAGNDRLVGAGGADVLYGQADDDVLVGGAGNDLLFAEDGNDRLNGGDDFDRLWAGNGDDVLITIDGGVLDLTQGDAGRDTYWADRILTASDGICGLYAEDKLQHVVSFANGADRTLGGDRIGDPTVRSSSHSYKRFSGNVLFSSAGPVMSDVRQGGLGDCYFLAGLAAIAGDNPNAIRQNVADFDDGTYGIRLGSSFYRVDDDLPVYTAGSTTPAYAKLGAENSMWVAIYEKAFAHYRYGANSYSSIEGGWAVETNRAFGSTLAGARSLTSYVTATAIGDDLYARWSSGQAVTIGFLTARTSAANAPLVMSHMYTVAEVLRNGAGVVTSVVLRNPWGVDGAGSDSNTSDGLVTVTTSQLLQYNGQVNWGRV